MKTFLCHIIAVVIMCSVSCTSDDDLGSGNTQPTISFNSTPSGGEAVCVGVPINLFMTLRAESSIGIREFILFRNNTDDTLFHNTTFSSNIVDFNFNYTPNSEDLESGHLEIGMKIIDNNNQVTATSVSFTVEAEFAYRVEEIMPNPGWDIVNNVEKTDVNDPDADLSMTVDTEECGFGCARIRITLKSNNNTEFYPIDFDSNVNYFTNTTKQNHVINLISPIQPIRELIAYSDFNEDFIPGTGALDNFPIVVKIRDSEEFAILDYIHVQNMVGNFYYKKRSEKAGE